MYPRSLVYKYFPLLLYRNNNQYDGVNALFIYSTPENDLMAFIDDDSLMDEHNRRDECRASSPSMSLRPPHLQNGWSSSLGQRVKQQQQQMPSRKPDIQMANPNMNNNNNNNNSNNANAGNEYCSIYYIQYWEYEEYERMTFFLFSAGRCSWSRFTTAFRPKSTTALTRFSKTSSAGVPNVPLQFRQSIETRRAYQSPTL